jgi:hypothetical protein
MIRFRFVHAADLHLDTAFAGMGRVTPGIQDALRDASLDAFDDLVKLAMTREAALVLLAGDSYDGPERGVSRYRLGAYLDGLTRRSTATRSRLRVRVWYAARSEGSQTKHTTSCIDREFELTKEAET